MVPLTVVLPRLGSFALALSGRITNAHGVSLPGLAGRSSFALNWDFVSLSVIPNHPTNAPNSLAISCGTRQRIVRRILTIELSRRRLRDTHLYGARS
jgi:hypothetical protein